MTIGNKKYTSKDYADFLVKRKEKGNPPIPFDKLVELTFEKYAREELYKYHDNH